MHQAVADQPDADSDVVARLLRTSARSIRSSWHALILPVGRGLARGPAGLTQLRIEGRAGSRTATQRQEELDQRPDGDGVQHGADPDRPAEQEADRRARSARCRSGPAAGCRRSAPPARSSGRRAGRVRRWLPMYAAPASPFSTTPTDQQGDPRRQRVRRRAARQRPTSAAARSRRRWPPCPARATAAAGSTAAARWRRR